MKWIDPVSEFFPVWPLGGGFCARSQMRCRVMHEIQFGKVMSCDTMQAEYLTKRQKGGTFQPI